MPAAHRRRTRTRYTVDEHGELGPVLVPKKPYQPRDSAKRARTAATGRPSPRPTSLADSYLAWRRAWLTCGPGGLAEDSPQITYHLQQIDRLRANLQTGGDTPRRQTPRGEDSSA